MTLHVVVLGAAAGGGLPQWNCGCSNCNDARTGRLRPRSQSSIAVSSDRQNWVILNASPDLRDQLARTPALHPTGPRQMPLASVVLTNGDIDHVAGLLCLRERQAFALYATSAIHDILSRNPVFDVLDATLVPRVPVAGGVPFAPAPGLSATLIPVPGKVPLYLERGAVETALIGEQTVGVLVEAGGKRLYYIPGCAMMTDDLRARLQGADLVLFDGTLWSDDEMIRAGLGQKTGRRMGHMPISGPDGTLAAFDGIDVGRKVFVHLNNTNPVWRDDGPERAEVEAAGWIVGDDGTEITL
ncbi:MAG: pyrroloquinoline quinone biosynthesis protein PqqB [Pseudomonadota bacterium]